ncbi:MAG: hypothetical protein A2Z21_08375 [Candidatus Fraserbacteria bacterium RBG_16_55_9]|uniref:Uncharacterized protein n=1 Tax=Fraserbacteria sp. (strain RBG_16_55_9) TaxID=1817864 RepID=A0A1F5USH3_FRAXR|nr:MAG: hypothetical protein A2Z21_08375 [Candidatus Fraserbacteria bacterium RBG_16_55_9]
MKIFTQSGRFWILAAFLIGCGAWIGLLSSSAGSAQSGSSLLIQAVASSRTAGPGSTDIASIYVTVQSSAGLMDGLTDASFSVFAEQIPAQGCLVNLVQVRTGRLGVYRLDIVPGVSGCFWRLGDYVLSVSVRSGSQSGAALVIMTLQ